MTCTDPAHQLVPPRADLLLAAFPLWERLDVDSVIVADCAVCQPEDNE